MLDENNAVLAVIDVQGKLARVVSESELRIQQVVTLVKGMRALNVPIFLTAQVPEKIGHTIPEVAELFEAPFEIPRVSFSVMRTEQFTEALRASEKRQVVLCGFETHICLYQSSLDLLAEGYEVYLVVDASSSRSEENKTAALAELRAEGAHLVTVESALFSMLKTAAHPTFKTIARLIK